MRQPRLLQSTKLSCRYEGKINTFPDEQKLREFNPARPVLQERLRGVIQTKRDAEEEVDNIKR